MDLVKKKPREIFTRKFSSKLYLKFMDLRYMFA